MSVTMTREDLTGVRELMRVLLAPLDHEDHEAWCRDVSAAARELFRADMVGMLVPTHDGFYMEISDYDEPCSEYPVRTRELCKQIPLFHRVVDLGTYDRAGLIGDHMETYLESSYYHEYVIPVRCFDSIGLGALLRPGIRCENVAQLIMHHGSLGGRRFGEREQLLLDMLLPAFAAGAKASLRLGSARSSIGRTLDALSDALFLFDSDGRPLHANRAAIDLLAREARATELRTEIEAYARGLRLFVDAPAEDTTLQPRGWWDGAAGRYELRGAFASEACFGPSSTVLIAVDRVGPTWPREEELRARFQLTPAQARVALLLARGLTNDEIATELGVSPATARNHSTRVREKLGVSSRARVASRILGSGATAPRRPLPS